MKDEILENIIKADHAPEIDVNARKRAVNLAVAEFKSAQTEKNKKTSQGITILFRLIGIGKTDRGVQTMENKSKKRFIYGATATAMAVVLVAGLSISQLQKSVDKFESVHTQTTGASAAHLRQVKFGSVGGGDEEVAPAYVEAVEQQNEANLDGAVATDVLTPVSTSKAKSASNDKLSKRRYLSEEKIAADAIDGVVFEKGDALWVQPQIQQPSRDNFEDVNINSFKQAVTEPISTFSSDVDTASYAFVRKSIDNGRMPSPAQVRVEEMVNYFDYSYPVPESRSEPFKPTVTVMDSPWIKGRKLMHVGIKGYQVEKQSLRSNLVFLLDVSGSMDEPDKLPLVKASLGMLLDSLHPDDTVSIVIYAGNTGVVLEPTKVSERNIIISAMDNLNAGGGTAGAAGISLAYDMAERSFDEKAVNRIILATDGDFNVGITDQDELKRYVEAKREKGIFLSVLGFGMGNYNDYMMQTLAQNGNGIAAYIDTLKEAQKVLVQEATSSLFPIAKDVKFQVEFNPAKVAEYRLIGYETRHLNREDFNNDKVDAGDIGAGHAVTAIYEFVPVGSEAVSVDTLRYGSSVDKPKEAVTSANDEYAFVKIRYKLPMENISKLITEPVNHNNELQSKNVTYNDTMFSVAVAAFAQKLQGGKYIDDMSYDDIIDMAQSSKGDDPYGYRTEFIQMVRMVKTLSR